VIRARIKPLDERMPGMCLIDVRRVVGHGNTQARPVDGRQVQRDLQASPAQRQAVLLASGTQGSETRGTPRSND
jgi:hypothetical protein